MLHSFFPLMIMICYDLSSQRQNSCRLHTLRVDGRKDTEGYDDGVSP